MALRQEVEKVLPAQCVICEWQGLRRKRGTRRSQTPFRSKQARGRLSLVDWTDIVAAEPREAESKTYPLVAAKGCVGRSIGERRSVAGMYRVPTEAIQYGG